MVMLECDHNFVTSAEFITEFVPLTIHSLHFHPHTIFCLNVCLVLQLTFLLHLSITFRK